MSAQISYAKGMHSLVPKPSHRPVMQAIKNWTVGKPGNEARVYMVCNICVIILPFIYPQQAGLLKSPSS